jgi:hypothetical protein
MSSVSTSDKGRLIVKTIISGAITVGLYAAAFTNTDFLMAVFSKGGYYAAFPIATVFAFSFAHGSFSSNLWSALGIDAVSRQTTQTAHKTARKSAQRQRPRLRMSL